MTPKTTEAAQPVKHQGVPVLEWMAAAGARPAGRTWADISADAVKLSGQALRLAKLATRRGDTDGAAELERAADVMANIAKNCSDFDENLGPGSGPEVSGEQPSAKADGFPAYV